MQTTVTACADELGVQIPSEVLDEAGLHIGDELNVHIENGSIVLTLKNDVSNSDC